MDFTPTGNPVATIEAGARVRVDLNQMAAPADAAAFFGALNDAQQALIEVLSQYAQPGAVVVGTPFASLVLLDPNCADPLQFEGTVPSA